MVGWKPWKPIKKWEILGISLLNGWLFIDRMYSSLEQCPVLLFNIFFCKTSAYFSNTNICSVIFCWTSLWLSCIYLRCWLGRRVRARNLGSFRPVISRNIFHISSLNCWLKLLEIPHLLLNPPKATHRVEIHLHTTNLVFGGWIGSVPQTLCSLSDIAIFIILPLWLVVIPDYHKPIL